jgi:hypothetical protein
MTTVAGIFISAPRDGQIYVAERSLIAIFQTARKLGNA